MSLDNAQTHHRTAQDELTDYQLATDNFSSRAWKDWPNEAGVRNQRSARHRLQNRQFVNI